MCTWFYCYVMMMSCDDVHDHTDTQRRCVMLMYSNVLARHVHLFRSTWMMSRDRDFWEKMDVDVSVRARYVCE